METALAEVAAGGDVDEEEATAGFTGTESDLAATSVQPAADQSTVGLVSAESITVTGTDPGDAAVFTA
jgi:hypothetical protein